MRSVGAVAVGLGAAAIAIAAGAGDLAWACGALVAAGCTYASLRRTPLARAEIVRRAVVNAVLTAAAVWVLLLVVALVALPDDFEDAF